MCILALHRSSASLSPSPVRRGAPVDGTPSLTLSVRRATGMFVSSGDVFPIDTLRSDRPARGFGRIFEWPVCLSHAGLQTQHLRIWAHYGRIMRSRSWQAASTGQSRLRSAHTHPTTAGSSVRGRGRELETYTHVRSNFALMYVVFPLPSPSLSLRLPVDVPSPPPATPSVYQARRVAATSERRVARIRKRRPAVGAPEKVS